MGGINTIMADVGLFMCVRVCGLVWVCLGVWVLVWFSQFISEAEKLHSKNGQL